MSTIASPLGRVRIGALSLVSVFVLAIVGYRVIGGFGWLESVWMVVITISTVGFGERSGTTPSVQILTILVILIGVTSAAYTFGGLVQLALEGEVNRALGRRKMTREILKLRDHVVICGFGRLGQDLAHQLRHREIEFVVVDLDPEKAILANSLNSPSVTGDATLEETLKATNLDHATALVTALPTDAENVFITLTARNLKPDLQIIAKSEQESSCRKLRQAGASKIVMPHRVGAQQMERMISRPSTADLVELFSEASQLDVELDEFQISSSSSLIGKTIGESGLKEQFNLLVVAIRDPGEEFQFNPQPSHVLDDQDTLLVIGQVKDINRLKNEDLKL
jgi:voltage-gated potassium channel